MKFSNTIPDSAEQISINRVLAAIKQIQAGGMVIMVDDEDRENEGDLVAAATHISPESINFMAKEGRGLICLTMAPQLIDRLELPLMQDRGKSNGPMSTAFTVSIEAKEGVSTGISAHDRAHTIKVAIDAKTRPDDLVVPGHVFPLKARAGGVLERAGHTEGSVDLAGLAGLDKAAVICEIMNEDGTMARMPDLERFAKTHDLPIVSIADLITYRLLHDSLVQEVEAAEIQTKWGTFPAKLFHSQVDDNFHLAIYNKKFDTDDVVNVRVHNQRPLNDIFGKPDALYGSQPLDVGMELLNKKEPGVFLFIGKQLSFNHILNDFNKLSSQKTSAKVGTKMDERTIGIGAQILRSLGVHKMRLFVSSSLNVKGVRGFGLEICDSVIISESPTEMGGSL